jgi:prepilin-type N-terminal cleavage/methylation domain-containing protein
MTRAKAQAGFTVVELLVAMFVLGIVAVGAMTLMEVVMRQGRGVLDRTESAQRGRLVLDQMTREIRSQVCLDETTKGFVAAAPNALTFYADLSAGGTAPVKRTLEYQASPNNRIVETVFKADGNTVTRVLLQNVVPETSGTGVFSYFAYPKDPPAGTEVAPTQPLTGAPPATGALAATDVGRVAVVRVSFAVRPHTGAKYSTLLTDQVVLRNADPNATKNDPTCQ